MALDCSLPTMETKKKKKNVETPQRSEWKPYLTQIFMKISIKYE